MSIIEKAGGIFLESDMNVGVKFQLWPDDLAEGKSVNWSSIGVIGRAEPIVAYQNSSAQQFSLTLQFVSSLDGSDDGTPQKVQEKLNFLKSTTYPIKSTSGFSTRPPVVIFILGEMIDARCVVNSYSAEWSDTPWNIVEEDAPLSNNPFKASSILGITQDSYYDFPLYAKVKMNLMTVNAVVHDSAYVRINGDRRIV